MILFKASALPILPSKLRKASPRVGASRRVGHKEERKFDATSQRNGMTPPLTYPR
ncbi:hypothetical protein COO91_06103 [Nostoc flagelliforme CCNUN1]|uniref:Uncharacterized protein n=1 Tax=Nostoc flagelliforme CCNUN1 TaxID=2038116 RepID=A0A2K8SXN0_9NOSO|nr:hypothetical protein COO91_06103 [Nostoc flagelliforme CCNUN1]